MWPKIGSLSASPSFGNRIKCGRPGGVGGGSGKSKMSRICKLDIACKHLARRQRTSSTSTRVREVGQGVTKKESSFGSGSKQTFELFAP